MKKALRKNFYMEIRHSLGRFLSIFFIVAIGCAFFSGIRASEPDMRYSGDAYFDEKNLMDIQVMSTMGLTEDDLDAIRAVDGIGCRRKLCNRCTLYDSGKPGSGSCYGAPG